MKLTRVMGLVVLAVAALGLACDETTQPPPPPPPPSIAHTIHYTKTFDGTGAQNGLQNNDVFDILARADGSVWIGNQSGVAIYANVDTTERSLAFDETDGLSNPKVRRIVEHNGMIYVATWGGGVSVYDVAADTWSEIRASRTTLANDLVSDIVVFEDLIYFATNEGVSEYDPVMDTWKTYDNPGGTARLDGRLLDELVSTLTVANTPRGKEWWYAPRVEFGLGVGEEAFHGITVTRETFDAAPNTLNYPAIKDNTIYEGPDTNTALSNGMGQTMWTGVHRTAAWPGAVPDSLRRVGLISFDITGIPQTAVISHARLYMRMVGGDPRGGTVALLRPTTNWGEGTSVAADTNSIGATATAGDATWFHTFSPGSFWSSPGGDYMSGVRGTRLVADIATVFWTSPTMAADVQDWLRDPASNAGWAVYSTVTVNSANDEIMKQFATLQHPNPDWRPRLEVSYREYQYITTETSDLAEPNVNDIMYDSAMDEYWVCFANEGIGVADYTSSAWRYYTMADGLPSNQVFAITKVNGVLWVATQNGIARQLVDGSWRGYNRNAGLVTDRVRTVYSDDGARLWLGYVEAGAGRVNPESAE